MNLHNNKQSFEELINETANYFRMDNKIVKQDYFVSFILSKITNNINNIVFKGGTSLSKCYEIIDRYSEDIDLSLEFVNLAQADLKNFNRKFLKNIKDNGFNINNEKDFTSGKKMNSYNVIINEKNLLTETIKIETFLAMPSFPVEENEASCYIYKYLLEINKQDLIEKFNLQPFNIKTQCMERTFIDKIFAICDYYKSNKFSRNSRHLYDLHKMLSKIDFNRDFKKLFYEIRELRREINPKINLSAQKDFKIGQTLKELILNNSFKSDFKNITIPLIFDKTSYEDVSKSLLMIAQSITQLEEKNEM